MGTLSADRHKTVVVGQAAFWEALAWLTLCVAWIWFVSAGDRNGIGYFQQPQNDLTLPLVAGGIVNAATFYAHAFYAIPRYLKVGDWPRYLLALPALFAANVVLQTVLQLAIIHAAEPSLRHLSPWDLAVENSYLPPLLLIVSALYRFARDWIVDAGERGRLESRATALERSLLDAKAALQAAGAGNDFLFAGAGAEKRQIPVKAIAYVKAAGNYAEVVLADGKTHLVYGALKTLLDDLPANRFARIHRSYIVSLEHITSIKDGAVHVCGAALPIGAAYKKAFAEHWNARAAACRSQPS